MTIQVPKEQAKFLIGLGALLLGRLGSAATPVHLADVHRLRELADDIERQIKESEL
jgi:hypothetical protein